MMNLVFGLFTQVSGSGPFGPLVSLLVEKMFSFCALRMEAPYLTYTYNMGTPTESSEPYLMMTCISWFTALRKKCSVSALRLVSQ